MNQSLAVILVVVYAGYRLYRASVVPVGLRSLPAVSFWDVIHHIFRGLPFDETSRLLYRKLLDTHHILTAWFEGQWYVVVDSPDDIRAIYSDTEQFPKHIFTLEKTSVFSKFLGVNVVLSNGDTWKRHRRVVSPPFRRAFEPSAFGGVAGDLVRAIHAQGGTGVDIHPLIQRLTMDALGKAILGLDFNTLTDPDVPFMRNYNTVMHSFSPLALLCPYWDTKANPLRRRYHQALEDLDAYFMQAIAQRRSLKDTPTDDLLSLMIKASDENDFSDQELRDNIRVFLLAGQDTTAFAITAALFLLATNKHVQARLRAEMVCVLGEEPCVPTQAQLREMPYLAAFIKEAMRMYPPVARLPSRVCATDVTLQGHRIPRGTRILIDTYAMHRDPAFWERPDVCDPRRFLDTAFSVDPAMDGFAWCPFGGGSRFCLGSNFSLLEQKVVLCQLLFSYDISTHATRLVLAPNVILSPKQLRLNFTPRRWSELSSK